MAKPPTLKETFKEFPKFQELFFKISFIVEHYGYSNESVCTLISEIIEIVADKKPTDISQKIAYICTALDMGVKAEINPIQIVAIEEFMDNNIEAYTKEKTELWFKN